MGSLQAWHPSEDEVRRIVAELRPVIDECVRRSQDFLAHAAAEEHAFGGLPRAVRR